MIKTTVKIDGMQCNMCETHEMESEPYVKKGLFGF